MHAEVAEWQSRPLDRVYPVIFLDALVCKVRDGGTVRNKAAHLAVGVDIEGRKEVLGIWVETTEGAKFWLRVMNELKARGSRRRAHRRLRRADRAARGDQRRLARRRRCRPASCT